MRNHTLATRVTFAPHVRTDDGKVVHEGDRVFNYYDRKWGTIQLGSIDDEGWFYVTHEDGSTTMLNGERCASYDPYSEREKPILVNAERRALATGLSLRDSPGTETRRRHTMHPALYEFWQLVFALVHYTRGCEVTRNGSVVYGGSCLQSFELAAQRFGQLVWL